MADELYLEGAGSDLNEFMFEFVADSVELGDLADPDHADYPDRVVERNGYWYVHGFVGRPISPDPSPEANFIVTNGEIRRYSDLQGSAQAFFGDVPDDPVFDRNNDYTVWEPDYLPIDTIPDEVDEFRDPACVRDIVGSNGRL